MKPKFKIRTYTEVKCKSEGDRCVEVERLKKDILK